LIIVLQYILAAVLVLGGFLGTGWLCATIDRWTGGRRNAGRENAEGCLVLFLAMIGLLFVGSVLASMIRGLPDFNLFEFVRDCLEGFRDAWLGRE
jgi:hypothetical protein